VEESRTIVSLTKYEEESRTIVSLTKCGSRTILSASQNVEVEQFYQPHKMWKKVEQFYQPHKMCGRK
jgi:hypothetical protein